MVFISVANSATPVSFFVASSNSNGPHTNKNELEPLKARSILFYAVVVPARVTVSVSLLLDSSALFFSFSCLNPQPDFRSARAATAMVKAATDKAVNTAGLGDAERVPGSTAWLGSTLPSLDHIRTATMPFLYRPSLKALSLSRIDSSEAPILFGAVPLSSPETRNATSTT